jgi:hypothetical protein
MAEEFTYVREYSLKFFPIQLYFNDEKVKWHIQKQRLSSLHNRAPLAANWKPKSLAFGISVSCFAMGLLCWYTQLQ